MNGNNNVNLKFALPSYKQTSKGGKLSNFTVTSGQYAGKNFKTKKQFDDFFARDAAMKQVAAEKLAKKKQTYLDALRKGQIL